MAPEENPDSPATGPEPDLTSDIAVDEAISDATQNPPDLATQLQQEKDRVLRLQADMQNLRHRTARELSEERRYATLPLIRDILPVLDNIDRAIEAAEQESDAESLLEGFRLVRQQVVAALNQHHCEQIEAAGQPFDPGFHQAILQQPSDEVEAGNVLLVTQSGYRLHDRVVRAAQVIVSSGPEQ